MVQTWVIIAKLRYADDYLIFLLLMEVIKLMIKYQRDVCEQMGTLLADGLGNKIQSSSWLLANVSKSK